MALSTRIREKIEQDLGVADDKKTLLVGLIAFVNGKPPPLEGDTTEDKPAKVKAEPLNLTEKSDSRSTRSGKNGKSLC